MVASRGGFEMIEENKKFNTPYVRNVLRGLGVLHSGIRVGNNTRLAWAHKRVEQFFFSWKIFKGEGTLPYPIYRVMIQTICVDGTNKNHETSLPRLR
jgi:hypothetical protein